MATMNKEKEKKIIIKCDDEESLREKSTRKDERRCLTSNSLKMRNRSAITTSLIIIVAANEGTTKPTRRCTSPTAVDVLSKNVTQEFMASYCTPAQSSTLKDNRFFFLECQMMTRLTFMLLLNVTSDLSAFYYTTFKDIVS